MSSETKADNASPQTPTGRVNLPKTLPFEVFHGTRREEDSKGRVVRPGARQLPLKLYRLIADFGEQIYLTGMISGGVEASEPGSPAAGVIAGHPFRSFNALCVDIGRRGMEVDPTTITRAFVHIREMIEDNPQEYAAIQNASNPREALADYLFGKIYHFPYWRTRPAAAMAVGGGSDSLPKASGGQVGGGGPKLRGRGKRGPDKAPRKKAQVGTPSVPSDAKPAVVVPSPPAPAIPRDDFFDSLEASPLLAAVSREASRTVEKRA